VYGGGNVPRNAAEKEASESESEHRRERDQTHGERARAAERDQNTVRKETGSREGQKREDSGGE
jgi:hypothetical protein